MPLFTGTQESYYEGSDGSFNSADDLATYGNYQFISLKDIINNFIISSVGEDKLISKIKRTDVSFHAQRAIQELSYDTFKSTKSQEIELPPSLLMVLPHDYVNYVKLTWKDNSGIEHVIYPAIKTSNPKQITQDNNLDYTFDSDGNLIDPLVSDTWTQFQGTANANNSDSADGDLENVYVEGRRYGLMPENAQSNGVFYIDPRFGRIHFSSDLSGKTITLKYISDGLGTDAEMIVHKFAEEAMYKSIAHAILSTRSNIQEYIVQRYKKEKKAAIRTAKLRLSNIKIEELTQIMRNKSKQIKH
jgi:hypothetical protein|tara:strand:+ start:690 stop:1595 length:906 start_codon:yes stop_codon:yes gene_type:complete